MALDVIVRAYTGERIASCEHCSLNRLCEYASTAGIPMLGHIDPYDDTIFNRMQMPLVQAELIDLSQTAPPDIAEAARELLVLVEHVTAKPHRYLVFSGD
ncbi:hypothetical protein [Micromonospora sp. LOL_023]|uniref:hypothetical protein n=1 Tax=Micromonospora sp. LOL_023 TaxID=3345418 RepID=UPI003A86DBF8